ncbi:MAG: DUF3631 domain-containing protein [Aeromicrobium erythreum]
MKTETTPEEVGEPPQPYPAEPLATTLDRIVDFNRRFVHHKHDSTHDLVALWVAHSYAMPTWDSTPRLYITAPQEGVGKSNQAKVMEMLCPDSLLTASTSGPGLFRYISAGSPTLFIDEAENQFSPHGGRDKEIVTAIINAGHEPGGYVLRSESNSAVKHPVYAPACIVGADNGLVPSTTRSRCIPIRMTPGLNVPERFRKRRHEDFATEMGARLADAAMDWTLIESDLTMRQKQLWEPLFSVAHAAGPEWVQRVEKAVEDHQWTDRASVPARTPECIYGFFASFGRDRATASELAAFISADDECPATSAKALAQIMKGYEVTASKSNGRMTYFLRDLEPVFSTWL